MAAIGRWGAAPLYTSPMRAPDHPTVRVTCTHHGIDNDAYIVCRHVAAGAPIVYVDRPPKQWEDHQVGRAFCADCESGDRLLFADVSVVCAVCLSRSLPVE